MNVINVTRRTVICPKADLADTPLSRLVGLLNRSSLLPQEGLIITQCRSIHMFFMKFPIDVIFVDKKNVVVGLVRNIQPFQLSSYFFRSSYVIESSVGVIDKSCTEVGDELLIE